MLVQKEKELERMKTTISFDILRKDEEIKMYNRVK